MSQHLEQQQTEQQILSLNGLQVALARLLEIPAADLSQRIENEMLENAALEEKPGDEADDDFDVSTDETDQETDRENDQEGDDDFEAYQPEQRTVDDDVADYLNADDVPTYLQERYESPSTDFDIPITSNTSFYDALSEQVGELDLTETETQAMEYLIGSLDNDGFLRKDLLTLSDELAIYQNVYVTEAELEHLLHLLQGFEPRGIGARTLQECLLLQVRDPEFRSPQKALCEVALTKYYKEFAAKHWDVLRRRLKLSETDFEALLHTLLRLNPKPGAAFNEMAVATAPTVVPDFFVEVVDDELRVRLNQGDVPELRVSPAFKDTLRQYRGRTLTKSQEEAYVYARQKVEAAQGFINMLRRRNATLLLVVENIVALQRAFFLGDDDEQALRPLTLRDVAERINMDLSTVSRVANSKYLQTLYGVYPLKYFFSSQILTDDGEELSSRAVKTALQEVIEAEDKHHPLSDEALSVAMKDKGFPIARRTVAKYRDQLGIPPQRLRKEHKTGKAEA